MASISELKEIKLHDLKSKTPAELLVIAEELQVENASSMRRQELMIAILKSLASQNTRPPGLDHLKTSHSPLGTDNSKDPNCPEKKARSNAAPNEPISEKSSPNKYIYDLLTTDEAAGYLRCSASYLNKLRCSGGGPDFVRLGRRKIVYRRPDLDSWVRSRRHESTSEYDLEE